MGYISHELHLGQNATEVGGPGPVPQKLSVVKGGVRFEYLLLTMSGYLEHLLHL